MNYNQIKGLLTPPKEHFAIDNFDKVAYIICLLHTNFHFQQCDNLISTKNCLLLSKLLVLEEDWRANEMLASCLDRNMT